VFSAELEKMAESLIKNMIPQLWAARSYPSLKPLANYNKDLLLRINMFNEWIEHGQAKVFWLSGFFFPQSFLTGVLQNFARGQAIPIDKLSFDFVVMKEGAEIKEPPSKGCYVNGLFLEGATWDSKDSILEESLYKVLYKEMPSIWMIPTEDKKEVDKIPNLYTCPLYKTSERKGTLMTTGHSTNFVLPIYLASKKPKEHWIKRGVALITQLNE